MPKLQMKPPLHQIGWRKTFNTCCCSPHEGRLIMLRHRWHSPLQQQKVVSSPESLAAAIKSSVLVQGHTTIMWPDQRPHQALLVRRWEPSDPPVNLVLLWHLWLTLNSDELPDNVSSNHSSTTTWRNRDHCHKKVFLGITCLLSHLMRFCPSC